MPPMPLDPEHFIDIVVRRFDEIAPTRRWVVEYRPVTSADGSRTVLAPAIVAVPADADQRATLRPWWATGSPEEREA